MVSEVKKTDKSAMSARNNIRDQYLKINNVKLHYLDWGGEGKVILFLAGLADTAYTFQSLAPRFTNQFHAIGLTRRGIGKSDAMDEPYDLDTLVNDIRGFLDALNISQVILVGHSYAGYEMTHFAARFPEKARQLVYLDAIWHITHDELEARANDPVYKTWPKKTPTEALTSIDAYYQYIRQLRVDLDRMWSPLIENMLRQNIKIAADGTVEEIERGRVIEAMIESAVAYNIDYSTITSPVLCIYAIPRDHPHKPLNADGRVREQARRYYMEKIFPYKLRSIEQLRLEKKDALIYELPGADHYCHISNEDEIYACVNNFLLS